MAAKFQKLALTAAVRRAQGDDYGWGRNRAGAREDDSLTGDEVRFIQARDGFYLATVGGTGWPCVEYRGGPPGFLRALSPTVLAFADGGGNRPVLTTGNLAASDKVALFLMDYPQQTRLRILGHARAEDAREHADLVARLAEPEVQDKVERIIFIEVVSFDWNCPQSVAPRYTVEEMKVAMAELQEHIVELNAQSKPEI
jgi:predicted pyridoxine 5'-phosphate oxidase superfamily flavin-nucleotide-binding protein